MPRPKTKEELLDLSTLNFKKLNDFVDSLTKAEQEEDFPEGTMNRNIRDVVAHLHHWHKMFLEWYALGMEGKETHIPAEGYNWRTLPALNKKIRESYLSESLEEIRKRFNESHQKLMGVVYVHTDEELFQRKKYKWTGNNAISGYAIGVLSSHYDWAYKLIKKAIKARQKIKGEA